MVKSNETKCFRYCGQDHPPQITSTDTTLTVMFKSDHSAAYDGFMASYKVLNATTGIVHAHFEKPKVFMFQFQR